MYYHGFAGFTLIFQVLIKRLSGKSISDMTYLALSGMLNLHQSVSQLSALKVACCTYSILCVHHVLLQLYSCCQHLFCC